MDVVVVDHCVAIIGSNTPSNDTRMIELTRQHAEVCIDHSFSCRTLLQSIHLHLLLLTTRIIRNLPKQFVLLQHFPLCRCDHPCEVNQQAAQLFSVGAWAKCSIDSIAEKIRHSKKCQSMSLVSGDHWQPSWRLTDANLWR